MSRTKHKHKMQTVFTFNELTDQAKDRARDWYRQGTAEDNFWHESVIEDAKAVLGHLGFSNVEIYWSGFSSQGDGACFTGTWYGNACNPKAVTDEWIGNEELTRIAGEFAGVLVRCMVVGREPPDATLKQRGNYNHEGSVSFDFLDEDGAPNDFDETITNACRDLMRWIYRSLEAEYEYQNSDEVVDEAIFANGYEFDEEGRIA